jgi:hypothetical protein
VAAGPAGVLIVGALTLNAEDRAFLSERFKGLKRRG